GSVTDPSDHAPAAWRDSVAPSQWHDAAMQLQAASRGRGPRVVLVHGFTQTHESWDPVTADLATDHEVVVVDAPGHGGSAGVRTDLWAGADLLADVGGR